MEMQPTLAIGLPFTPTVGCRIDFNSIPLEALTPCTMLSTKLVFSPIKQPIEPPNTTPRQRRDLSVISEEAVDISKELDCYQLQLENSMNEAKASKKRGNKNLIDIKNKTTFAKRLAEQPPSVQIGEVGTVAVDVAEADEAAPMAMPLNDSITSELMTPTISTANHHSCHEHGGSRTECPRSSTPKTPKEQCIAKLLDHSMPDKSITDNPDVVYEEVEESQVDVIVEKVIVDEAEFKNPAPFVRTYRRDVKRPIVRKATDEANNEVNAATATAMADGAKEKDHELFGNIRSSIRKSIRRIMKTGQKNKCDEPIGDKDIERVDEPPQTNGNFLSTLRQSLRRKKVSAAVAPEVMPQSTLEMSIIDYKDRAVFKEGVAETKCDNERIETGFFGTKTTIRHSFRKSSRRVIKSVLNKNVEDYSFDK